MDTNPLLNLSVSQLNKAAQLKEQIDALNSELGQILGAGKRSQSSGTEVGNGDRAGRGRMSAAGRARIAAAARARWAKIRAAKGETSKISATKHTSPALAKKKRTMSPAARAKIAAAQRARWAKVKAGK